MFSETEPSNTSKSTRTALRQFYAVVNQKYPEEKRLVLDILKELLDQYFQDFFRLVLKEDGGCYNSLGLFILLYQDTF